MSREAMQIALEALEANLGNWAAKTKAIPVLRQALVDADDTSQERVDETVKCKHEPVAWISDSPTKGNGKQLHWTKSEAWRWSSNITPLYTAPPKRELTCVCGAVWEGEMMAHPPRKAAEWFDCTDAQLMDEVRRRGFVIRDAQIDPVKREWVGLTADEVYECWMSGDVVAAVEAKLKEKNHG
jgi:hypothetical protein